MDAVEYLKQLKKICGQYADCHNCPFWEKRRVCSTPAILEEPEKIVEAVEKWAAEHPVKTRQSEFLKMFPNAATWYEVINICPQYVEEDFTCPKKICQECRKDYWLAEVE